MGVSRRNASCLYISTGLFRGLGRELGALFELAVGLVRPEFVENQLFAEGLGGVGDDGPFLDDDGSAVDGALDEAALAQGDGAADDGAAGEFTLDVEGLGQQSSLQDTGLFDHDLGQGGDAAAQDPAENDQAILVGDGAPGDGHSFGNDGGIVILTHIINDY